MEIGILPLLNETLDMSESEAIALAQQMTPRWIILADLATRRTAEGPGLPVIGTLGVLLLAKNAGYLPSVKPVLDQLRSQSLFITDALCAHVLNTAGETE